MNHRPTPNPFASAQTKIRWAASKAEETSNLIDRYFAADPIRTDTQRRGRIVELITTVTAPLPEDLSLLVGDWAHSLRSALDHIVFAHVDDPKAREHCAFPSWRKAHPPTPRQWSDKTDNAVPGPGAAGLRSAIKGMEPWRGGKDENLWVLTELDNVDKHRVLLSVAAAVETTQRVTRAEWVTQAELSTLDMNDGLLLQISTDTPPSHPFIKDPTLMDVLRDPQLVVKYAWPEVQVVTDGGVLESFTRNEWRHVLDVQPTFQVVLAEAALGKTPVLQTINEVSAAVIDAKQRLERATGAPAQRRT